MPTNTEKVQRNTNRKLNRMQAGMVYIPYSLYFGF